MSARFRVCCGHCQAEILTDVEVLTEAASAILLDHLRREHPTILPADQVALGDLLKHFDFRTD